MEASLRESQELMTTILRDFDIVCKKNNLNYWIDYGTLLGAVRHGGFIPWDDDIDVGMTRADYEKFIKIANKEIPNDLYFQDITTDEGVEYQWVKIRHKESEILEEENPKYRSGMFIDIFPYDFYDEFENSKQHKLREKYVNKYKLVYNSNLNFEKSFKKNIKRAACKILSKTIVRENIKELIINGRNLNKNSRNTSEYIGIGVEILEDLKMQKTKDIFPVKTIKFENIVVNVPNNFDIYLKNLYGDNYMDIPKEEDRYFHNIGLFIYKKREI